MTTPPEYEAKLGEIADRTLLPRLDPDGYEFVRGLAVAYHFTFQELRQVAQAARDLEMWGEPRLESWWRELEAALGGDERSRKKELLRRLRRHMDRIAGAEKTYPRTPLRGLRRTGFRLADRPSRGTIFGRCPAYSEKTLCCGLFTIDAVLGCPLRCSYCAIQSFYGDAVELTTDLAGELKKVRLDPDRFYHVGTGQASDSLVWGNKAGQLDALLRFARRHPNCLLELKTKTDRIEPLLKRRVPANVVCSWSLNSETIIRHEEHGTATLERRLEAAREVADRGLRVGFHFHPLVFYQGWRDDYRSLAARLLAGFSPEEVAFVSLGAMTFIRPVAREIRRIGGETKVLQMRMVEDATGKLGYPDEVRLPLYRLVYEALRPWHGKVFLYLCMEPAETWRAVLGRAYASTAELQGDLARRLGFPADGPHPAAA